MPQVSRRNVLALGGAVAAGAVLARTVGSADAAAAPAQRVYIGTYTSGGADGKGIGKGHLDGNGNLVVDSWLGTVQDPSWLAIAADRKTLFSVSERLGDGQVHALRLNEGGDPSLLNAQPTGSAPTHVAIHPGGKYLFTSLYDGGATVVHKIAATGKVEASIGTHGQGIGSHAHQVVVDPSGKFVLAVDLGANKIFVYSFDTKTGKLAPLRTQELAPGAGPRHLVFHPNGKFVYVANELNSTVTVFEWKAASGELKPVKSYATLKTPSAARNYPGEIAISKDGRFVYVSNRGANSVSVFATGAGGAVLTLFGETPCGDWPRHLAIDPTGKWLYLANQRANTVEWFDIDATTGALGEEPKGWIAVTAPTRVLFA